MANPLNIDYGRFDDSEIRHFPAKEKINGLIYKAQGLIAINTILRANEIDAQVQGRDSQPISNYLVSGLQCAAVQLSEIMSEELEALGLLLKEAKW